MTPTVINPDSPQHAHPEEDQASGQFTRELGSHIFSFGMGVLPLIGVGDEKGVLRAGREAKSLADARRSTP